MKQLLTALGASLLVLLCSWSISYATSTFITQQGGTGTSTPSGILYGDNGSTSHVNTVTIGSGLSFSGGTLSASGGAGSGTISTSSAAVVPNLLYFTDASHVGNVATTSATCTGSASCSPFTVIGSSPITINATGGAGGSGTVATSGPDTVSQVTYFTTTNGFPAKIAGVATSSLTVGTGLTNSGTLGALVGGLAAQISFASIAANSLWANNTSGSAVPTAIATSSLFGLGTNGKVLAEVNGVPTWVATTTAGTGLTYDGTSFNNSGVTSIVAGSNITISGGTGAVTINATGGGTGGAVGTSTNETTGQLPYWTTTSGTPARLGSVATTTLTGNNGLTLSAGAGALVGGSNATIGLASVIANSVMVNQTSGSTFPSALATTTFGNTLYGVGTGGQILYEQSNGTPTWTATTTFNSPLTYSGGAVSCGTCLTGNQTITLSGAVTGSGATAITTAFGTLAQGILGNPNAAATIPTALATSSLYLGTAGQILAFNNGVWKGAATTTAGTGLSYDGSAFNFASIAANSLWANNTGVSAVPSVIATSTLGIAISDTTGTLTVARGGTGQTSFTAGNLLYGAGSGALQNVATTTVSCSGSTSCTQFVAIGGSPITISSTAGGGSGGGTFSTTTTSIAGTLFNYPNNNTDILNIGSNSTTTGSFWFDPNKGNAVFASTTANVFLGIGSTTPYSLLSINAPAGVASYFSIGSSSSQVLDIKPGGGSGQLGIGTSSPSTLWMLAVGGNGSFDGYARATYFTATSTTIASTFPQASTTELTAATKLFIPNSAKPTVGTAGEIALDSTAASTSLRINIGGTEQALYTDQTGYLRLASTTLDDIGNIFSSATTTWGFWYPFRATTLNSFTCKTDKGTLKVGFGTGSATTTDLGVSSTWTTLTPGSNNVFTRNQQVYIEVGTAATAPNVLNCRVNYTQSSE